MMTKKQTNALKIRAFVCHFLSGRQVALNTANSPLNKPDAPAAADGIYNRAPVATIADK
jgi:hypothetical protein